MLLARSLGENASVLTVSNLTVGRGYRDRHRRDGRRVGPISGGTTGRCGGTSGGFAERPAGRGGLLRTLAEDLDPAAGRIRTSAAAVIGYMAQEQETLDPCSTALGSVRAECAMSETEARSFLHIFLFSGDDPLRPIAELSFGERARLSLALLVARGATVLLLDEPLNHLDLDSRERFETALHGFNGAVVVASHDRYFVERFASTVWEIRPEGSGRHTLVVAS